MRWGIPASFTRQDADHYLELVTPFVHILFEPLPQEWNRHHQKLRAEYLDAHEEITRRFGATTSSFIDAVASALNGRRTDYTLYALKQYEELLDVQSV